MRTCESPTRSTVHSHCEQPRPGLGAVIAPTRMRLSVALVTIAILLMMPGCSRVNPTEPTPAGLRNGLLERRIGDVGGGGGTGECHVGEQCGIILVVLSAPDDSTFEFICSFRFDLPLPQKAVCDTIANGIGTGRFSDFTLAETIDLKPSVTVSSSKVDLTLILAIIENPNIAQPHGFLSEGQLTVQAFFRESPCVGIESALRLEATGVLPRFGRVTATITGNCPSFGS